MPAVSAIVPARDEEERIGVVLDVLTSCEVLTEIIVIDDGSVDRTAEVAKARGAQVITQAHSGKGRALARGVEAARSDLLFFCDADLIGLTPHIVTEIIAPVASHALDLFIGCRDRSRYPVHRTLFVALPMLEGQRALTRDVWQQVPDEFKTGFGIEAAMNFFGARSKKGLGAKVYPELSQVSKEQKYGRVRGMYRRCLMYAEIVSAQRRLHSHYA